MHLLPSTVALGATCSYVCPVPGRLHRASSYSGARKSRHYRVGDPGTRSRDRFTLKAMAKGGAFMRREKKRSIKEGIAVNPEMQKSNILPKIFAKYFEGNESQKNVGKRYRWKEREARAAQSKRTCRGVCLKKPAKNKHRHSKKSLKKLVCINHSRSGESSYSFGYLLECLPANPRHYFVNKWLC